VPNETFAQIKRQSPGDSSNQKYELHHAKLLPTWFCPVSLDFQYFLEPTPAISFHISLESAVHRAALGRVRKSHGHIFCKKPVVVGAMGLQKTVNEYNTLKL